MTKVTIPRVQDFHGIVVLVYGVSVTFLLFG